MATAGEFLNVPPMASTPMFRHRRAGHEYWYSGVGMDQLQDCMVPTLERSHGRCWQSLACSVAGDRLNVLPLAIACMFHHRRSLACSSAGDRLHVAPPAIACMFRGRRSLACSATGRWRSNNNCRTSRSQKAQFIVISFRPALHSVIFFLQA